MGLLDFIFTNICHICESAINEANVCKPCLAKIRYIQGRALCSRCGMPFGFYNLSFSAEYCGHLCGRCISGGYLFDMARSVAYYEGILRDMLHEFKYRGVLRLSRVLSHILIYNYPVEFDPVDVVIPVPLHLRKLRQREYNQVAVLGQELSKYIGSSFDPFVLRKQYDTRPQFEMKGEGERRRNVRGTFVIEDLRRIKGKSVLLLDDVFTTGSTLNECTGVLLKAGAGRVQVLTLMRTVH